MNVFSLDVPAPCVTFKNYYIVLLFEKSSEIQSRYSTSNDSNFHPFMIDVYSRKFLVPSRHFFSQYEP